MLDSLIGGVKAFHLAGIILVIASSFTLRWASAATTEVLIYGGTPSGIAAAISAAKGGRQVVLIEPTYRIGGLVTSGLSHTDFHSFESLSGRFLDFAQRVERFYQKTYGQDSSQVIDSFHGTFGEPKVNLSVFEAMLAEHPRIEIVRRWVLDQVTTRSSADGVDKMKQIASMTFLDANGRTINYEAKIYIDATYEGDVMAKAGVAYRVGREGKKEFGESLAPDQSDSQLQAYNFRFVMTKETSNRVTPVAPPGYRREDFVGVLKALESGKIEQVFGYPRKCLFKAQTPPLPNGKYDINDVSQEIVRLSLPGKNLEWPDGDVTARRRVFNEHLLDQVGLLYFLQHDERVPKKFGDEARQWGWCRDEFTDTEHLPPQLYIREARRMQGVYIYTQKDSDYAPGDVRAKFHRDAIAMADYGNNCHGTSHEGGRFDGKHTGEFYNATPPYQIPYGVLLPRELDNLMVPGAVSSSHVGFCALRLEPVWMSLGQAAGHAASLAIENKQSPHSIDVAKLQARLHADRSATIYVSDIPPDSPDFAMVQWWGTLGGLHGLEKSSDPPKPRGKKITSQYSEAAPLHAAQLDRPLDDPLRSAWMTLANRVVKNTSSLSNLSKATTRRAFLEAVWTSR